MAPQLSPALLAAAAIISLAGCSVDGPSTAPTSTSAGSGPPASGPAISGPPATPGPTVSTGPVDLAAIAVALEPFAEVPGGPLAITAPDDGSGRLFVASQDGTIWAVDGDGSVASTPMVDLGPRLQSGGEQGLLGIAVHPAFPTDPRIFVNYTDKAGDTIVASLEIDPDDPGRILSDSHRQLLFIDQPFANHNGGEVLFGPDGYLYVFMGDGGAGGDPQDNGQSTNTLLGKVLRVDIDGVAGDLGYSIPPGNPYADADGRDEIWQIGMRNPWRASFDRTTGDLWIGDVGQGSFEEIDVARAGQGGLNFGWNLMEGDHCFPPGSDCRTDGLTPPITEYGRDLGCTVIGGYTYRGPEYAVLRGAYLFADYCSGRIFAIDAASTELVPPVEVGTGDAGISSFGEDLAGELYVTTLEGSIFRVVPTRR